MCNLQVQQFVRTKAQLEKWTQLVQAQPEYTSKLEQGKQEYTTLYHNVLSQQTRIRSERLEIAVKQSEMLTQLDELQTFVEQELERWKAKQKQKSIGMVVDESLDQTQQWCEQLAYYTWTCRQSILKADGIRKMTATGNPTCI
ncbi:PREDICTED: signal transducer and activator of transcription 5B-like [Priapulus caudatus]|uniref:Signal transducer and activator of transcription 5B-like n=1 Tax=Priapulus caudatus TaxID=37621 RepID=A0ABM1E4Q3_PRICU|nr:PREDICTED: signal transducer and activator of transcription 5B-like [Priapulus caudatus]